MGWAGKHLTEDDRKRIAQSLFEVTEDSPPWLNGHCPFHDDKQASFGYNYVEDAFKCLAECTDAGDLIKLYSIKHGLDDKEGFREFKREFGAGASDKPLPAAKRAKAAPKKVPPDSLEKDLLEKVTVPLDDAWYKRLANVRGWSREVIDRLQMRLQTHYRDKASGAIKKLRGNPERVAIPVFNALGELVNIRLYKPFRSEGDSTAKIFSWAKGHGDGQLFPAKPGEGTVFYVEGEPDTACGLSHGINVITHTSKPKTWDAVHLEAFKGRDVVIIPDADVPGFKYARFAAAQIEQVAASVRVLQWPDAMGRDANGEWPESHGMDLTDWFMQLGKTREEFMSLVDAAVPYQEQFSAFRFFSVGVNGRSSFRPRLLAEQLIKDCPILYCPGGSTYRWNGRFYEEFAEDHLRRRALDYLGEEGTQQRVNDAVFQARTLSILPHGRELNDSEDWVCLKNTMFNILTGETRPHDRGFYGTYQLNVELDPAGTPRPSRWLAFLRETIQTPEAIAQAQEFFGYCLTRKTSMGKCLLLYGPGSDGKSVFIKVLRMLVGPENTSAVPFAALEDQFQRASLYNKLLNIATELGSRALESEYFKAIVTGDPINAAFKHQDSFEFRPFCKLVFATNKLPRVLDNSHGFFRRILPITFKRQFFDTDPDHDPDLEDKLYAELSGIFEWAIVGLHRLLKQKRFTDCDESRRLLLDYKRLNNPVLCFVEDKCELDAKVQEEKETIYTEYKNYCRENGYNAFNRENFFVELRSAVSNLQESRPRSGGKRVRVLTGIKVVRAGLLS